MQAQDLIKQLLRHIKLCSDCWAPATKNLWNTYRIDKCDAKGCKCGCPISTELDQAELVRTTLQFLKDTNGA